MTDATKATVGTRVKDGKYVGTIVEAIGGMYTNRLVNVYWDNLGYTNWENPTRLTVTT